MTKSTFLIYISICFAAGIWIGSEYLINNQQIFLTLAGSIGILVFSFFCKWKTGIIMGVLGIVMLLGLVRLNLSNVPNEFTDVLNTKQQYEGYIVEDIDIRTNKQLITFQPKNFRQRILLSVPLSQTYFYGDWVAVTGKLKQPTSFNGFDYNSYLRRYNIYATMDYPTVLILKSNQQNKFEYYLLKIKDAFTDRLGQFYAEPEKSLLLGILIGAHKLLPQTIVDNFSLTGTSHIIAISGYNITIIVTGLMYLAPAVGRKAASWAAFITIICFIVITGASASVLRAGIMGMLVLIAGTIGRQYKIQTALFFAAAVMLIQNPKILMDDVGFQLSFLATLGIVYFMPLFEQLTASWPKFWGVKNIVLTTLAAIIATTPILIFNFGTVSLISPVVNILILPMVEITMLFGFLSLLPIAGAGFAFATKFLLRYILWNVNFFAHLPYAYFPVVVPPWYFALLCLALLGFYRLLKFYAQQQPVVES